MAALSVTDIARLERLSALAYLAPEQLWPDVWLYGFDDVEEGIHADIQADEDIAAGKMISNEDVKAELQRMFGRVEPT